MAITVTPPTMPQVASIPSHQQNQCPFCASNTSKEIRFESFNQDTGLITTKTMDIYGYSNLIMHNHAQPELKALCKPIECYCPTCFTAFSISKSLGII